MRDLFEAIAEYMSAEGADARREHAKKVRIEFDLIQERMQEMQSRIEALEKDSELLHDAIMNIPPSPYGCSSDSSEMQLAYKIGHRDARHAAAELVVAMQSEKWGV